MYGASLADPISELLRHKKQSFYDAHERRSYERHWATAMRLMQDPTLVENARAYLERFVRHDERQQHAFSAWQFLFSKAADEVAFRLIEDTEHGAFLRETAPPFRHTTEAQRELTRRQFP